MSQHLGTRRGSQSEPDLLAAAAAVQGQKMSPQGAATPGREGKTLTSLGGAEVMMTWEQNDIDTLVRKTAIGGTPPGGLGATPSLLLTAPQLDAISRNGSVRSIRSVSVGEASRERKISTVSTISSKSGGHSDILRSLRPSPTLSRNQLDVPPSHKPSVPINLQPYVHEALETASDHIGRTPTLRKISLVKEASGESATDAATPTTPNTPRRRKSSVLERVTGVFRKKDGEEEETALVFSFDDGPKISITNAEELLQQEGQDDVLGMEREPGKNSPDNSEDSGITFTTSNDKAKAKTVHQDSGEASMSSPAGLMAATSSLTMLDRAIAVHDHDHDHQQHHPHHHRDDDVRSVLDGSLRMVENQQHGSHLHSMHDSSSVTLTQQQREEQDALKELARKQRFWDYLTMVTSFIYAIAIVVFGFLFYLADIFIITKSGLELSSTLNIYLCVVGSAWLIWLAWDINVYISTMKEYEKKQNASLNRIKLVQGEDGELLISIPIASKAKKLPEYYCFATDRHSGSFFLKMGAALFCVGHLVHIGLQLGREIVFFLEDEEWVEECRHTETLIFYLMYPFYVFLQLFMIFKYSNVIVNRNKGLARFALMHCIASSVCFWLYTIKNETMDSIVDKEFFYEDPFCTYEDGTNNTSSGSYDKMSRAGEIADCWTPETVNCAMDDVDEFYFEWSITCLLAEECKCADNNDIAKYIFDIAPYLYPFSIEFSILVVAIWYIMWNNIGNMEEHRRYLEFLPASSFEEESGASSAPRNDALYLYADCHSTMKGLFFGLSFVVLSIIGIVIYFVLTKSSSCETQDVGDNVNDYFEMSMLLVMIAVTVWVYQKLAKLDVNPHPISALDDLLLYICIPSFFFYATVHMVPMVGDAENWADMSCDVLLVLQMLIQTPMIIDGLRRCSDSAIKQDRKPGRNLVAFLLIANMAIYFWETMEIKNVSEQTERKEFYGAILWTLFSHVALPLCIFYRFHSSVALADIWGSAYRPGNHHH